MQTFAPFFCLACLIVLLGCSGAAKQHKKEPAKNSAGESRRPADDGNIPDVDEPTIDEIVDEGDRHLVIIFYDNKLRCPSCTEALKELEEIDDDLEGFHIQIVKTDDKSVAKELGVYTLPGLVYYRRKHPILYDGDFEDSETVLRWVLSHDEVVVEDLDDDTFEDTTDSFTPSEGSLDWFVMFYNSKDKECNSYVPVWETVAHRLRGQLRIGRVDIAESDDVAERFKIDDDDDCPSFLVLHRGKMFRYTDSARNVRSLTTFALHGFKEQKGHRVPNPPTLIAEFYEDVKEGIQDIFEDHGYKIASFIGFLAAAGLGFLIFRAVKEYRRKKLENKEKES